MSKLKDLTGQRFGRLTVIERAQNRVAPSGKRRVVWNCICDCGTFCTVRSEDLQSGHTLSCGCLQIERSRESSKKYNKFRVDGDLVFVKLSNSDEEMIANKNTWLCQAAKYCWCVDKKGYAYARGDGNKTIYFHILAFPDCPDGMVRDHIDGNKLNNTRSNVRFVSQARNMQNQVLERDSASGRVGVSWDEARNKWIAQIGINKKNICLGRFSDLQDAIAAREAAEIKYFGEYRRNKY